MRMRIGGIWYSFQDEPAEYMSGTNGETCTDACLVRLSQNLSPERIMSVRFHEILHACWRESGLGDEQLSEERVVSALTPILLGTLREHYEDILDLKRAPTVADSA